MCNNIHEVTAAMAKYIKNPIPVEANEYRYGLEDGFDDLEAAINAGLKSGKLCESDQFGQNSLYSNFRRQTLY